MLEIFEKYPPQNDSQRAVKAALAKNGFSISFQATSDKSAVMFRIMKGSELVVSRSEPGDGKAIWSVVESTIFAAREDSKLASVRAEIQTQRAGR